MEKSVCYRSIHLGCDSLQRHRVRKVVYFATVHQGTVVRVQKNLIQSLFDPNS